MILQFAFFNILLISLGVLLYVIIRTIPRLDGTPTERGMIERWLTSELPRKLDVFFHGIYVRTLRRLRVTVLKIDNSVNRKLELLRLERGEGIISQNRGDALTPDKPVQEVGEETGVE
jgi:DNA repair exonuclease SbcCD nuclease subunit